MLRCCGTPSLDHTLERHFGSAVYETASDWPASASHVSREAVTDVPSTEKKRAEVLARTSCSAVVGVTLMVMFMVACPPVPPLMSSHCQRPVPVSPSQALSRLTVQVAPLASVTR